MNNPKLFLAVIISFLFFTSCQKEYVDQFSSTPPTVPSTFSRVKTYTEDYITSAGQYSITFNLNYDASGRLASMISTSSPGDKIVYQYNLPSRISMDLYNAGTIHIHSDIFLNSYSFIDSIYQFNNTQDTSAQKYFYNTAKQLVKLLEYEIILSNSILNNTTNYTYDASGNLIKEVDNYETNTYTYTSLLNTLSLGFDYLPSTKYLVQTTVNVSGGVTTTLNHTYTFDTNNRLTSEKIITSDGDVLIKKYTY